MSTNFGLAGIPGTRLKVPVWVVVGWGGSHTHYCITPVPRLGAGALMLNAWDWTVTNYLTSTWVNIKEIAYQNYNCKSS